MAEKLIKIELKKIDRYLLELQLNLSEFHTDPKYFSKKGILFFSKREHIDH